MVPLVLDAGVAAPPIGAGVEAPGDPRIDGIMCILEVMENRMDQQVQNQATAQATAATAPAAALAVAPAEVLPGVVATRRPIHQLVEPFLKLKPQRFMGIGDPEAAFLWIQDLEKAFALLVCNEEEKVVLAMYQLQGNANIWWRAAKDTMFPESVAQVWNTFLGAFNEQYFSSTTREQKIEKFQHLHQRSMTVHQYGVKFAELSQYVPRLIEDLEEKAWKFRSGLRSELKQPL
ncbi:uncharacterized protein LOC104420384 [Eucalyptus grandis]|uniref:uncharacterized protein LOC104420384 n=1 Tax=Eucalyptus grandis TaxID=71139 RepID=UPI00192EAC11|nr:uncharacterized protein LOC104420384 [Eucalyptus grandis]